MIVEEKEDIPSLPLVPEIMLHSKVRKPDSLNDNTGRAQVREQVSENSSVESGASVISAQKVKRGSKKRKRMMKDMIDVPSNRSQISKTKQN